MVMNIKYFTWNLPHMKYKRHVKSYDQVLLGKVNYSMKGYVKGIKVIFICRTFSILACNPTRFGDNEDRTEKLLMIQIGSLANRFSQNSSKPSNRIVRARIKR